MYTAKDTALPTPPQPPTLYRVECWDCGPAAFYVSSDPWCAPPGWLRGPHPWMSVCPGCALKAATDDTWLNYYAWGRKPYGPVRSLNEALATARAAQMREPLTKRALLHAAALANAEGNAQ